jgi:MEDS: MEthanogen/methylotroph, DcmR Sensory domain
MALPAAWPELPPGSHACLHYATDDARRQALGAFFGAGLELGQKLVYVSNPERPDDLADCLAPAHTVGALLGQGRLEVLDGEEAYLKGGRFDSRRCARRFHALGRAVLSQGFAGLRVYADNDWLLPLLDDVDEWIDYELQVGHMTPTLPIIGMCGFDGRAGHGLDVGRVDAGVLDAVHPVSLGATPRPSPYAVFGTGDRATALAGEVDFFCADQAAGLLAKAVAAAPSATVDLAALDFIDAAGTCALFRTATAINGFRFRHVPAVMAQIWLTLGYQDVFPLEVSAGPAGRSPLSPP